VSSDTAAQAHEMLKASGETVYRLGEVQAGSRDIIFD
jgi:hypothetical protein